MGWHAETLWWLQSSMSWHAGFGGNKIQSIKCWSLLHWKMKVVESTIYTTPFLHSACWWVLAGASPGGIPHFSWATFVSSKVDMGFWSGPKQQLDKTWFGAKAKVAETSWWLQSSMSWHHDFSSNKLESIKCWSSLGWVLKCHDLGNQTSKLLEHKPFSSQPCRSGKKALIHVPQWHIDGATGPPTAWCTELSMVGVTLNPPSWTSGLALGWSWPIPPRIHGASSGFWFAEARSNGCSLEFCT